VLASVPGFVEAFEEGRRAVEKLYEILKPIRDGIGGHDRPKNAVQDRGPDPTPDAIRAFGGDIFEVHLDEETGRATNLRHLTASAFLFVWPDVKNYDQYIRKYHELVDQLEKSLTPILHGIDVLLCLHWIAAGIEPGYTR